MLENIVLNNPRLLELAKTNEDVAKSRTILEILKHIFEKFSRGERNINLETEGVYIPLVKYSGLKCGEQQDMSEFIVRIIDIILIFYSNIHVKQFIDSIMYNQIEYNICVNGKEVVRDPKIRFPDEKVMVGQLPKTLDLAVDDRATDIQQLITIYQEVERMESVGDILDSCVIEKDGIVINANKKLISKRTIIRELASSEYCLISLKRRLPKDDYGYSYYKKTKRFETNPYLIIDNSKYQIIGCGLHIGDANGGHYVYIGYDDNGRPAVTFNDSLVYQVQQSEVELINTNAYMFLYKKIGIASGAEVEASKSVPVVSFVMQSPNLQEIRRKITQINEKIQELRVNPSSEMNIMGLNGFIEKAIQLYTQLSEKEKKHIGAFIPREAFQYLKIQSPDNLIS
jgi:hypothetical protein